MNHAQNYQEQQETKRLQNQHCPVRELHIFFASSLVAASLGGVIPADWR
jgi:hypothetical protein